MKEEKYKQKIIKLEENSKELKKKLDVETGYNKILQLENDRLAKEIKKLNNIIRPKVKERKTKREYDV